MEEEAGNKNQDYRNQAAQGHHAGDQEQGDEEAGAEAEELDIVAQKKARRGGHGLAALELEED